MEELLKSKLLEQKQLGEDIEKLLAKYKKEPQHRRKEDNVVKQYGEKLENLWQKFLNNHEDIINIDVLQSTIYLKEDYKGKVENIYKELEEKLGKVVVDNEQSKSAIGGGSEETSEKIKMKEMGTERQISLDMLLNAGLRYEMVEFEKLKKEELEFIMRKVDQYFDKFEKAHFQLIQYCTGDTSEMVEDYNRAVDIQQSIFVRIELQRVELTMQKAENLRAPLVGQPFVSEASELRLPRVDIPKFYGEPGKWTEFRDLFSVMVHQKTNIPGVQKMQYLKTNVCGPARDMIKHLAINNTDYQAAWDLLNKRFNNKKLLVDTNLKRLFTQRYVQVEKSEDIKKLLDTTKEENHSLLNLGERIPDCVLVFIVSQRLPNESLALWEQTCGGKSEIVTFEQIENFLENRFRTLETIEKKKQPFRSSNNYRPSQEKQSSSSYRYNQVTTLTSVGGDETKCPVCKNTHSVFTCPRYNGMSVPERQQTVRKLRLCEICLGLHGATTCKKTWRCYKCRGKHNTSLHLDKKVVANTNCPTNNIILATAVIKAIGCDGHIFRYRALVDQGSMVSFVTEKVAQQLGVKRMHDSMVITGIGGVSTKSNGAIKLVFMSAFNPDEEFETKATILPTLTSWLPGTSFKCPEEYEKLQLADPNFNRAGGIDIILGSDVLKDIILDEMKKGTLLAQKTRLGWILSGPLHQTMVTNIISCAATTEETDQLDKILMKFWEVEERDIDSTSNWTEEEIECEKHYTDTTQRDVDGRYITMLPFKNNAKLGKSKYKAVACMYQLEKKFRNNLEFKAKYIECMRQYLQLGHAVPARKTESYFARKGDDEVYYECFYLPHLAVIREDSVTTKTRVVFNASSKSANGKSLNDCLMVGPTIQRDIVEKICRFRLWLHVFLCDAEKMYRQIKMDSRNWPYQRFVWRENDNEPLQDYALTTVTFGEASAPFTAIRTLKQIAIDNREQYPLASGILENDCYVDDIHMGSSTIDDLAEGRDQLVSVLQAAGFSLRKWSSNSKHLLERVPEDDREQEETQKFMGIRWNSENDYLSYAPVELDEVKETYTKREVLTQISKVFDPMGWITPILIKGKLIMQNTWKEDVGWDQELPQALNKEWLIIRNDLQQIGCVRVPRWVQFDQSCASVEPHGFSDASKEAYGAVVYIRVKLANRTSSVHQILAKSRVKPIKDTIIAKLELKAAAILVEIMKKCIEAFGIKYENIVGWCDSKVALAWIQGGPGKWKLFVRNKVKFITSTLPTCQWHYVKSKENPADIISRGCTVRNLLTSQTWWHGPTWLQNWTPTEPVTFDTDEGARLEAKTFTTTTQGTNELLNRIERSSFCRTTAVTAWILRFINKCRRKCNNARSWLTVEELREGHDMVIRLIQKQYFSEEFTTLKKGKRVKCGSRLSKLSPFMEEDELIRMRGRLAHANIPYVKKHSLIIPQEAPLTIAIIREAHKTMLHGGANTTLNHLREKYWIIKGYRIVKNVIHNCVICSRAQPILQKQLMGQLPEPRVNFTKPFLNTGVDFAGPISIKFRAGRGIRSSKAYICVFVCLAIKAFHLELVSSLSSDGFIAALKRMTARRGKVENMYSDNGTNFVGAFRKLEKLHTSLATDRIQWHFNPPSAPHFGGLWEAGVKSVKQHLVKVIGTTVLTYEEMTTVLAQIENCLNSRPLYPLTDDPEDLDTLTPNHFLIGQFNTPEHDEDVTNQKHNLLT